MHIKAACGKRLVTKMSSWYRLLWNKKVLKTWTRKNHLTVVSIFHDLNLAGLYCDRLLLLNDGKLTVCGTPDDVLKKSRIEEVYHATIEKHPHPEVPKPQMMIVPHEETDD